MMSETKAGTHHPLLWTWPMQSEQGGWQNSKGFHAPLPKLEIIPLASQTLRSLWAGEEEAKVEACSSTDGITGKVSEEGRTLAYQMGVDIEAEAPECGDCPAAQKQGRKNAPCGTKEIIWAIERNSGEVPIRINIPGWLASPWRGYVARTGQNALPSRILFLSCSDWENRWGRLTVEEVRVLTEDRIKITEKRRDDTIDAMMALGVNLEVVSSGPVEPPDVSEETLWLFAGEDTESGKVSAPAARKTAAKPGRKV